MKNTNIFFFVLACIPISSRSMDFNELCSVDTTDLMDQDLSNQQYSYNPLNTLFSNQEIVDNSRVEDFLFNDSDLGLLPQAHKPVEPSEEKKQVILQPLTAPSLNGPITVVTKKIYFIHPDQVLWNEIANRVYKVQCPLCKTQIIAKKFEELKTNISEHIVEKHEDEANAQPISFEFQKIHHVPNLYGRCTYENCYVSKKGHYTIDDVIPAIRRHYAEVHGQEKAINAIKANVKKYILVRYPNNPCATNEVQNENMNENTNQ